MNENFSSVLIGRDNGEGSLRGGESCVDYNGIERGTLS